MSGLPEGMDDAAAQAAAEELMAAVSADRGVATPAPAEPVVEQSASTTSEAPGVTEPQAPVQPEVEDSFIPRADLESLLEGVTDPAAAERITEAYKSFQAGFTRKTQELAEQRKVLGEIDPSAAKEAFEWVQALQTDRDFALQVHQALSNELQRAGLTKAQADSAASEATSRADVNWEDAGIDPDNPLIQKLQELEKRQVEYDNWRQAQEVESKRQAAMYDIQRQDAELRRLNPKWEDDDYNAVYKLAAATEGDLFEAADFLKRHNDRVLARYVESKAGVPASVGPVGSATSEIPQHFANLDEAHDAAKEFLNQAMAQG